MFLLEMKTGLSRMTRPVAVPSGRAGSGRKSVKLVELL